MKGGADVNETVAVALENESPVVLQRLVALGANLASLPSLPHEAVATGHLEIVQITSVPG